MDQLAMGDMESFKVIAKTKQETTLGDLCSGETEELAEFVSEVFSYRFSTKPNYLRLHNLLKGLYEKHCNAPLTKKPSDTTSNLKNIDEKMDPRVMSIRKEINKF